MVPPPNVFYSVIIYSPSSSKPVWISLFCWTQRKIFWRMWEIELFWGTIDFAPKEPAYKLSSKYLSVCSAEQRHSYRFGTTWGWVNHDRNVIFGWTLFNHTSHYFNINWIGSRIILKEYSAVVTKLVRIWLTDNLHALISVFLVRGATFHTNARPWEYAVF